MQPVDRSWLRNLLPAPVRPGEQLAYLALLILAEHDVPGAVLANEAKRIDRDPATAGEAQGAVRIGDHGQSAPDPRRRAAPARRKRPVLSGKSLGLHLLRAPRFGNGHLLARSREEALQHRILEVIAKSASLAVIHHEEAG